ncbi:MAG TPA: hypothetical protein VF366_07845, partial [Dehalococcoidia bacterium]
SKVSLAPAPVEGPVFSFPPPEELLTTGTAVTSFGIIIHEYTNTLKPFIFADRSRIYLTYSV